MNSNFEDLLRLFNANRVEYLIVGGYAVMLYTEPRYTKDLDIWITATSENSTKVYAALAAFGAPLAGLTADDFAHEGFFYQLGQPPLRIDILMSIEGVTFDEAWPHRVESHIADFLDGHPPAAAASAPKRRNIVSNAPTAYFALLTASISSGTI
jgi:hypothetical protein